MFGSKDEYDEFDEKVEKSGFFSMKKRYVLFFIKILIVILIISAAIYIIKFIASGKKSGIFLSTTEIMTKSDGKSLSADKFNKNDLIFFLIFAEEKSFEASMIEIQLSIKEADTYHYYKKIIYETSPGVEVFTAVIPRSYVDKTGNYRVSVFIKGDEIASQDIEIN